MSGARLEVFEASALPADTAFISVAGAGLVETWYGIQPSPSEPIVEACWSAMLDRLLADDPDVDGLWIRISEAHRMYEYDGYRRMAGESREKYGHLVKSLDQIRDAGTWRPTTDAQLDSDFACLHLASRLVDETREMHPGRKIGIAWCDRLYLFDAMDAIFPQDVPLLSLEACICRCKETRVPMEWGRWRGGRRGWCRVLMMM